MPKTVLNRLFNTALRLGSLGAKLVLTLYMGRYLGLSEMGTYGLVAAYVAIAIPLLGMRLDYCVTRDIVDAPPLNLGRMMRDQAVFYGLNYVLMIAAGLLFLLVSNVVDIKVMLLTLLLGALESFATITSTNLVSLHRPILANFLFFLRASLWVVPVMALGILDPAYRNADTVFVWWLLGVVVSLLVTTYIWRDLPWRAVLRSPVDWHWIKSGVGKSVFIWIGAVGLAAGTNIDRFFIEGYLGRDYVGIVSFYGSFIVAISSLLSSGIFAFSFPKLISLHRIDDRAAFAAETRRMTLHATGAATLIALGVGTVVPLVGSLFHRPEFVEHAGTLWLMLLGIWLRSVTESLYYVMYARHQDRDVWIGNLLLLVAAIGGNAVLVPLLGFAGIGYSAVLAALLLCAWRLFRVKTYERWVGA